LVTPPFEGDYTTKKRRRIKIKDFIYELFFEKRYSIVDILSRIIGIIIGLYIFSRYISPIM